MGMHASSEVVYGIDLGDAEYNEPFVRWLETEKGFKFNPDKRKAQWLLTASYG